jgi:hypothetical protein
MDSLALFLNNLSLAGKVGNIAVCSPTSILFFIFFISLFSAIVSNSIAVINCEISTELFSFYGIIYFAKDYSKIIKRNKLKYEN